MEEKINEYLKRFHTSLSKENLFSALEWATYQGEPIEWKDIQIGDMGMPEGNIYRTAAYLPIGVTIIFQSHSYWNDKVVDGEVVYEEQTSHSLFLKKGRVTNLEWLGNESLYEVRA